MKLEDLAQVNHLVNELKEVRTLIGMAERAEPAAYQVFIEAPGDSSLKMSAEGATTSHANGVAATPGFLAEVKRIAVQELRAHETSLLKQLRALGVDTGD